MANSFDACLNEVLIHEGGFVNHPKDPGGMTNLGVTKATYEDWIGHPVTEDIMRKLNRGLVAPLYKRKYWEVLHCGELPLGLDMCVFDFGVNAGTSRAARYLQRMLGVIADGVIGPKTVAAAAEFCKGDKRADAIRKYQDMRRDYYRQLKTFPTFGKGWLRRVDEVEKAALKLK